jgi:hypothetical protein
MSRRERPNIGVGDRKTYDGRLSQAIDKPTYKRRRRTGEWCSSEHPATQTHGPLRPPLSSLNCR